jgi:competence protein ComGC
MVFNVKKINGLTLIETMVAITLLSLMVLGTINYFTQRAENMRSKQLGNDMALVMNAIDKKLQLDAYSDKSWKSSSWNNVNEFMTKLIGEELRTSNSTCGQPGGWVAELAPDPLALIPCDRLTGDFLPNGVQVSANYTTEPAADGGRNISLFTIDYSFKDKASFTKNFGTLVKAQKALDKFETAKNLTVHSYNYFNTSNKAPMTLEQCLGSTQMCGLRTQIESFVGLSTDKIRIDGKNDLMGEIDFDNADTKCSQWTYAGGTWSSKEIKCTVEGGFDSKVGSVDAFINNTTIADRISLKDTCELTTSNEVVNGKSNIKENWLADTTVAKKAVPCGLTNDGSIVVAGFSKTNTKITVAENAITRSAKLNSMRVKYDANLYGGLKTNKLTVQKATKGSDVNVSDKFYSVLTDIQSSVLNNIFQASTVKLITNQLQAVTANLKNGNADTTLMKVFDVNGIEDKSKITTVSVTGNTLIDTRDPKYVSTNGLNYQKSTSKTSGNIEAVDFYSGYSTLNDTKKLADQSWNTLKINNITGKSNISITGSTKDEATIKKEMNNQSASPLDIAIYKDSKTFYSDSGSSLVASKLASAGEKFTSTTPPSQVDENSSSIYAEAGFADEQTVVKGKMEVQYQGSPRVTVTNDGKMTILGKSLGNGNTTADFMLGWPAAAEGSIWENGFRNKVFRSSLVTIVKGAARFYGDVIQWKPLHVNSVYQGNDVCDRPGGVATVCLSSGWRDLNTMQSILQKVKAEYNKLESKFPIKIGDKGDVGEQGFKGTKGQDGDVGSVGVRGPQGPMQYLKVNS